MISHIKRKRQERRELKARRIEAQRKREQFLDDVEESLTKVANDQAQERREVVESVEEPAGLQYHPDVSTDDAPPLPQFGDPRPPLAEVSTDEEVPTGTVAAILSWVDGNPERAALALDAERHGKNRTTLVSKLTALVGSTEEE